MSRFREVFHCNLRPRILCRKLFSRNKPSPTHPWVLLLARNGSQKDFILRNYLTLKCTFFTRTETILLCQEDPGEVPETSPRGTICEFMVDSNLRQTQLFIEHSSFTGFSCPGENSKRNKGRNSNTPQ